MSPPEDYDGNGTFSFREHRLLILDALKRHEDEIKTIKKQLWAVLVGLAAFMAKYIFDRFAAGGL